MPFIMCNVDICPKCFKTFHGIDTSEHLVPPVHGRPLDMAEKILVVNFSVGPWCECEK